MYIYECVAVYRNKWDELMETERTTTDDFLSCMQYAVKNGWSVRFENFKRIG